MTQPQPVTELDLLAYADGLLDRDPERKARVEEYLRGAPEAAARVDAYRAQTTALQAAYDQRAQEPVPQRLHNALKPAVSRGRVTGWRAAAMLAVSAAAGLAGWYLGQMDGSSPQLVADRLPPVLQQVLRGSAVDFRTKTASTGADERAAMLRWEENGVAVSIAVPDLSELGYRLAGRKNITRAEGSASALSYAGPDGARLRLVIAPAPARDNRIVATTSQDSVPIAHWSQGPLSVAVQAENGSRDVAALARDIRDTIARESPSPRRRRTPGSPEFPVPPGQVEVTADAFSHQGREGVESPIGRTVTGVEERVE